MSAPTVLVHAAIRVLDAAVARSRDSHELYRLNALRRWVLTGRLPERAA